MIKLLYPKLLEDYQSRVKKVGDYESAVRHYEKKDPPVLPAVQLQLEVDQPLVVDIFLPTPQGVDEYRYAADRFSLWDVDNLIAWSLPGCPAEFSFPYMLRAVLNPKDEKAASCSQVYSWLDGNTKLSEELSRRSVQIKTLLAKAANSPHRNLAIYPKIPVSFDLCDAPYAHANLIDCASYMKKHHSSWQLSPLFKELAGACPCLKCGGIPVLQRLKNNVSLLKKLVCRALSKVKQSQESGKRELFYRKDGLRISSA